MTIQELLCPPQWLLEAKTKNADVEWRNTKDGRVLHWLSGTWISGTWESGVWHSGEWKAGIWKHGIWYNGTWHSGTWKSGSWCEGTWHNGNWYDGYWHDGTWCYGDWFGGTWIKGTWEDGDWNSGTWKAGTWLDGIWHSGIIRNINFRGISADATFQYYNRERGYTVLIVFGFDLVTKEKAVRITSGCRNWSSFKEAFDHWKTCPRTIHYLEFMSKYEMF